MFNFTIVWFKTLVICLNYQFFFHSGILCVLLQVKFSLDEGYTLIMLLLFLFSVRKLYRQSGYMCMTKYIFNVYCKKYRPTYCSTQSLKHVSVILDHYFAFLLRILLIISFRFCQVLNQDLLFPSHLNQHIKSFFVHTGRFIRAHMQPIRRLLDQ